MSESVQNAFPYITGATIGVALLLFLVSFRLFRRSRTDVYWRRRRDAGQRGWRLFVLGSVLVVISGGSCFLTILNITFWEKDKSKSTVTEVAGQGTATAGTAATPLTPAANLSPNGSETPVSPSLSAPNQTPTAVMTNTPVVVIITTTPVYTPTETPFPTFTPYVTPLVSNVTPLPHAQIKITALDDQISAASTPLNPRTTFDAGTRRVYLFVEFKNMASGVLWTRNLYWNGELIDGNSYLWGLDTEGSSYFFFGNDTGFEPGNYEIRLFIGESSAPASLITFIILPAP